MNKMASWLSHEGSTQICVARGPGHGGVGIMIRQESFNFGIMRGMTITAFMPARQREITWRYVKLLMLLVFTSKRALTKSKRY